MRFTQFHSVSYSSSLAGTDAVTSGNWRLSCKSGDRSRRSIDSCSGIGRTSGGGLELHLYIVWHWRNRLNTVLCRLLWSADYLDKTRHKPAAPGISRSRTAKNRIKAVSCLLSRAQLACFLTFHAIARPRYFLQSLHFYNVPTCGTLAEVSLPQLF